MGNIKNGKLLLFSGIFIALFIVFLIVLSSTRADHLNITGLSVYSEDEFLREAGLKTKLKNTYIIYAIYRIRGLRDIPYIDTYSVKITDSHTLEIRVYESNAVACVMVMEDYFLFDKNGRVVGSARNKPENIPLVTGLEFNEIMMFKPLHIQKQHLFTTIMDLLRLLDKYGIETRELNFDQWNEVTVYTDNLTVLLGYHDKYDAAISALNGIYAEASQIGGIVDLKNYSEDNRDIILR